MTPTLTCSPPSSLVSLPPSAPKAPSASPSPPPPSACRTVAVALGPYLQNVRALASQLATVGPGPLDLEHCSLKGCQVSPARSWIDFQRQSLPFAGAICVLSAPGEQEGKRDYMRTTGITDSTLHPAGCQAGWLPPGTCLLEPRPK